jgi:hypothetical protein
VNVIADRYEPRLTPIASGHELERNLGKPMFLGAGAFIEAGQPQEPFIFWIIVATAYPVSFNSTSRYR